MKKRHIIAATLVLGLLAVPTTASAREVIVDGEILYLYVNDNGMQNDELDKPVTMHVDGRFIASDVMPTIRSSRTLVPLRAAGEALDAQIIWDQSSQTATATKDGNVVQFLLNSPVYTINGQVHYADVSPILMNNRTMLPLRVLAEALNANVTWDQDMYDVSIDTTAPDVSEPNIPEGAPEFVTTMVKKFYVQPDSADPFIGSWYKTYSNSSQPQSVTHQFIFVTKYSGGYYCINMNVTPSPTHNFISYRVTRDIAGRCENAATHLYSMSDLEMYYMFGYATDSGPVQYYYTASANSLQCMGRTMGFEQQFYPASEFDFLIAPLLRF